MYKDDSESCIRLGKTASFATSVTSTS